MIILVVPRVTTDDVRCIVEEAERQANDPCALNHTHAVRMLPMLRRALKVRLKRERERSMRQSAQRTAI